MVNLQETDFQESLGGNGRTILQWILKKRGINTRNWVDSAQDRGYWGALVNASLNLRVPQAMELVNTRNGGNEGENN